MIPSCSYRVPPLSKIHPTFIRKSVFRSLAVFAGLFLFSTQQLTSQESILDKRITVGRVNSSLYEALNLLSEKSGCLFIYDSQVVDNQKKVRLKPATASLGTHLEELLQDPAIKFRVIGRHVLLYRGVSGGKESPVTEVKPIPDTLRFVTIKGRVLDAQNNSPLPFASIGLEQTNLGTITNMDGFFVLKVPSADRSGSIIVSHMGFMSRSLPVELLQEEVIDIPMARRVISIQEVIIRYIDPLTILNKALSGRSQNYNQDPVYMTLFYREGVTRNEKVINYSEAVFKVYKSSYLLGENHDQVKLLKSRKVQNTSGSDTVQVKLKAGILTGLQLDLVKTMPTFLDLDYFGQYDYTYSDMISFDDQDAYSITFTSRAGYDDTYYSGTIFIDHESFALLGASFEVNPVYLDKVAQGLVSKKSRNLAVKFEKISYQVSYRKAGEKYYLNHARSDLRIRTRLRHRLNADHFNTFMEIASCGVDTLDVERFGRAEVLKPDVIFSEVPFVYDETFWGDYNFIAPEEKLGEALSRLIGRIEKID